MYISGHFAIFGTGLSEDEVSSETKIETSARDT